MPEATIAQRIVRAKRTLADERIPFEIPPAPEQAELLGAFEARAALGSGPDRSVSNRETPRPRGR